MPKILADKTLSFQVSLPGTWGALWCLRFNLSRKEKEKPMFNTSLETQFEMQCESETPGGGNGHIRCLGVVPIEIEELLREIQSEIDAE